MSERLEVEPLLFERLLRLDAELKNAVMAKQVRQLEAELASLRAGDTLRAQDAAVVEAHSRFAQIVQVLEDRYKIRMTEWSMCTETGTLQRVGPSTPDSE